MLAVMSFVVGGILQRFPNLRVAFLEANVGWLPFWLERLDEHWELTPEQAPNIDRKPSEYILSGRCFIGCDQGGGRDDQHGNGQASGALAWRLPGPSQRDARVHIMRWRLLGGSQGNRILMFEGFVVDSHGPSPL
jgi:hypothetical protein